MTSPSPTGDFSQVTRSADEKLAELLLIVADALKDVPTAGAVKVNKICYYAECAHMRSTGKPLTGAEYHRIPEGPGPRRLKPVRGTLVDQKRAEIRYEELGGYIQHRLVALDAPRWDVFSETEQRAIRETLTELLNETGTALSNRSHAEDAWNLYEDKETIPLVWAFASGKPPGPRALKRADELAAKYGLG